MNYIFIWFGIISLLSVIITAYDKTASKTKLYRIPEKSLFLAALSGGAVAMLLTMLIIHHKTRHAKFMVGLPIIIILHIVIILAVASLV